MSRQDLHNIIINEHSHNLACFLSHFILIFFLQDMSGKFWWSGPGLGEPSRNKVVWRDDYRCGHRFPLQDGHTPAQCNPESEDPCCSEFGWCGKTKDHCNCKTCIDNRTDKMGKL